MEKLLTKKNEFKILLLILLFSVLSTCTGPSNSEVRKVRKELDSLSNQTYTKEQLDIRIEIEGYEISKRMLYDNNAIIRTAVRPDDKMKEYDDKIKALREKIK